MQKIQVIDPRDGSQIPFLRGILTRSIQNSGIPFDEAYSLAQSVRDSLSSRNTISTDELREIVVRHMTQAGFAEEAALYKDKAAREPTIHIVESDGNIAPFSKGRISQSMEICGFEQETAYQITKSIEVGLVTDHKTTIPSSEIAERIYSAIVDHAGEKSGKRYLQWRAFSRSGRPLILLVGGTTGSGKSSISSELAHHLDIVRTQSTDMLREVMRLLIPERLLPTLHASSFLAHSTFSERGTLAIGVDSASMISGYLSQADQVGVGIEGVLNRAENEQVSLIIEGVHIHPALQTEIVSNSEALVVPIILAVLKKKRLRKRLIGRGQQITSRRSERYLENFDYIWSLQDFLLAEADHFNIPIVENADEDEAIRSVLQIISDHVAVAMRGVSVDP